MLNEFEKRARESVETMEAKIEGDFLRSKRAAARRGAEVKAVQRTSRKWDIYVNGEIVFHGNRGLKGAIEQTLFEWKRCGGIGEILFFGLRGMYARSRDVMTADQYAQMC